MALIGPPAAPAADSGDISATAAVMIATADMEMVIFAIDW
jgi:hypothetical protein